MIALIQRVREAEVRVGSERVAAIGRGVLALIGVQRGDCVEAGARLLERILSYRVFPDAEGRMNVSLREVRGGLLLVPQFTLAADTSKGMRPSFSSALAPEAARGLFDHLLGRARALHPEVASGRFGEHMQVSLTNEGPVTFWLRVSPARS